MIRTLTIALAGVALASAAHASDVSICAGPEGGNYEYAVTQIREQLNRTQTKVIGHHTAGSLENLERMDLPESDPRFCPLAIVQSDALAVYKKQHTASALSLERARALYKEYVHFICNKDAGISKITGLNRQTRVLTGPNGGGSSVTWASFVIADPKRYEPVPTRPIGGTRAAGIVQEGTEASCMLHVIGLNGQTIRDINEVAKQNPDRLHLVAANDSDLPGVKGPDGKPMYGTDTIPSGTYTGGLQPKSLFGSSVDTITVDAILVAKASWIDAHEQEYQRILGAVTKAMPDIRARVGQ